MMKMFKFLHYKRCKKLQRLLRLCALLVMLCFFLSTGVLAVEEGGESTLPLQIEPQVLDFGRVNESDHVLELSFTIRNVSSVPVDIVSISSGCGCTAVSLSQRILKAGESVLVPIKVNVLGRRGNVEQNVQVSIAGYKEPIIAPIKGKVVQDIWFEGPMVQCFVKESETTVEKTFEIRTIDYPSVQFDWKLVDEALHVEEVSRGKDNDETVITLRLRMEVPLGQPTTSRHLVLVPLDKRIKQLVVPVVCYRALSQSSRRLEVQKNGKTANEGIGKKDMALSPKCVNLGLIPYGEEQRFNITGQPELLGSLKVVGHEQLPQGTSIALHYDGGLSDDVLSITIHVGESLKSGLVRGTIRLQSLCGDEYSIDVIGLIGPRN
jgi:hypothetical protein